MTHRFIYRYGSLLLDIGSFMIVFRVIVVLVVVICVKSCNIAVSECSLGCTVIETANNAHTLYKFAQVDDQRVITEETSWPFLS